MWHEARKQEKKIRGMLVDYRRRAERRQDFYERIRADPTQFMQVHGRKSKIHLDPAVAQAGDSATIMMPWQGQKDNIIDRFDARAHLDFIPPPVANANVDDETALGNEERHANYERFRILAHNEFLGISEEKFLQQLYLEEQYGVNAQQEAERAAAKKAQKPQTGAAIGYTYEDSTGDYPSSSSAGRSRGYSPPPPPPPADDEDSDDDEVDVDVCINIGKLDAAQGHELNKFGRSYGMLSNDFYSFLTRDADEADAMRLAREEEHEKVLLGGRKSRRERRAQREKKFIKRFQTSSPPSYATKEDEFRGLVSDEAAEKAAAANLKLRREEENESRSPSPVNSGEITYITSFGGEEEVAGSSATGQGGAKGKSQTMSRLQQLKSQLTLGSIIGEKRDQLAASAAGKAATSSANEIVAKPVNYRRRSRSRSPRSDRKDRYGRHRRRRRSSSSRSRSVSSTSSRDNRSRQYRRGDRRKRGNSRSRRRSSSSSSRSNSSSSRSSYSSRGRSRKRSGERKSKDTPKQKPANRESPKRTQVESHNTAAVSVRPTVVAAAAAIPRAQIIKPVEATPIVTMPEVPVPVKKYYGRRKEDQSDSELSYTEDEGASRATESPRDSRNDSNASRGGGTGSASSPSLVKSAGGPSDESKGSSSAVAAAASSNPRDRLKRKMQSLLNKQYKADKKAEHERSERQMQIQQERDEEMRELAIKLRKRQRELRHRTDGLSGGVSSDEDALNDGRSQAPDEDEEERQIQARLHKLVAMSRENEQDDEEPKSRRTDRRDYGDRDYEEQRERRYRQRDGSRERYSSSVSHSRRRRDSHDASPSRPKSSRWDAQRRKSPSESGNHSRSRRLVDY